MGNLKTHWVIDQAECSWKEREEEGLLKWEFQTVEKWNTAREFYREL